MCFWRSKKKQKKIKRVNRRAEQRFMCAPPPPQTAARGSQIGQVKCAVLRARLVLLTCAPKKRGAAAWRAVVISRNKLKLKKKKPSREKRLKQNLAPIIEREVVCV